MLFAIDAGNTNTTFGVLTEKGDVIHEWRLHNNPLRTADEYAATLFSLFKEAGLKPLDFKHFLLCSVVPNLNNTLKSFITSYFQKKLYVIGEDPLPLSSLSVTSFVDRPEAVGDDRLINFVAANKRFGGPLLVVDFGTATTFDFVDEQGNHLGGAIAPGASITANALSEAGALLPRLPLKKPETVVGTWTIPQMQSGVFWGYVGLFEGLIERLISAFMEEQSLQKRPRVVATGGLSLVFKDVTKVFDAVIPSLIFEGLWHVYKENLEFLKDA